MEGIGNKIKEIRKRKGLSQEELAEKAKVNLRTIQRIENNESEPRGTTLNLICEALDINSDAIYDYGKREDNSYHMLVHLSVLSCGFIPLGNILIPLVLWISQKDKIMGLNALGANVINFQICWTAITFILFVISMLAQNAFSLLMVALLLFLNVIFAIILAVSAYKGKDSYYPNLIQFIKV